MEACSEFWTIAQERFKGVITVARDSDGFLTLRSNPSAGTLSYSLTVEGTEFTDQIVSGLATSTTVYEIPLAKGDYILNFSHSEPVLVTWRPAGSR